MPAWQAYRQRAGAEADLFNAITLNSAQFNGARAFGPALTGLVLARSGRRGLPDQRVVLRHRGGGPAGHTVSPPPAGRYRPPARGVPEGLQLRPRPTVIPVPSRSPPLASSPCRSVRWRPSWPRGVPPGCQPVRHPVGAYGAGAVLGAWSGVDRRAWCVPAAWSCAG